MKDHKETQKRRIAKTTALCQPVDRKKNSATSSAQVDRASKETEEIFGAIMGATHESCMLIDREGTVLLSNTVPSSSARTGPSKALRPRRCCVMCVVRRHASFFLVNEMRASITEGFCSLRPCRCP